MTEAYFDDGPGISSGSQSDPGASSEPDTTPNSAPAPASPSGAAAADRVTLLTQAMTSVLKAAKPLEAQGKAVTQETSRRQGLWEVFLAGMLLPDVLSQSAAELLVRTGESGYLAWLVAHEALQDAMRALKATEESLKEAGEYLTALVDDVAMREGLTTAEEKRTYSAAVYMKGLYSKLSSRISGEVAEAREPAELVAGDEEAIEKLRKATVAYVLFQHGGQELLQKLTPLMEQQVASAGMENIPYPVRPIEEEIQRYLSQLENICRNRQQLRRDVHPLLKARLKLVGEGYTAARQAFDAAVAEAEQLGHPSLVPYIWAHRQIAEQMEKQSAREKFGHSPFRDSRVTNNPDQLDIYDRAIPGGAEADQIDYLRKQTRVVAFAIAHQEEAQGTLKAFNAATVSVSTSGADKSTDWASLLAWYEDVQTRRAAAELENLTRTTKVDLLNRNIEHYKEEVRREMTALYKALCAMIPRNGAKPCNELRTLMNQAAYICRPLEGSEAAYPIYS